MKDVSFEHGINTKCMDSWKDFLEFIDSNVDYHHFVWRGQSDAAWLLEPTLDRELKKINKIDDPLIVENHLKNFKYAIRGRRGLSPIKLKDDNDWWALGQHQNLFTPLLDWTKSPFVAAFFAFSEELNSGSEYRAIYGISKLTFQKKSKKIKKIRSSDEHSIIEFIEPFSDENMRLVSQGGLFTKSKMGVDVETWVVNNFDKDEERVRM